MGTHTPAHQVRPSAPVDPYSRGLRTHKRGNNSQRWCRPCNRRCSSQHHHLSSHRVPLERVPPTQQRQQQGTSTSTIEGPTPKAWRVYGYYPGFPSSSATAYAVSTRTPPSPALYMRARPPHSHRTAISLQTLTRPSCPRVRMRDMMYRRFEVRTSPF